MPKPPKKPAARPRSRPTSIAAAAAKPRAPKRSATAAKRAAAPAKRSSAAAKSSAAPAKRSKPKKARLTVAQVVAAALEDLKALEVSFLDVRHLTTLTDAMVIASGRSDRHVRAIASAIVEQSKKAGYRPIGVEGDKTGEWVLVDLADVVVHVMQPRVREFYNLEKLWDMPARDEAAEAADAAEAGA
jgi:ribosome-associated protein